MGKKTAVIGGSGYYTTISTQTLLQEVRPLNWHNMDEANIAQLSMRQLLWLIYNTPIPKSFGGNDNERLANLYTQVFLTIERAEYGSGAIGLNEIHQAYDALCTATYYYYQSNSAVNQEKREAILAAKQLWYNRLQQAQELEISVQKRFDINAFLTENNKAIQLFITDFKYRLAPGFTDTWMLAQVFADEFLSRYRSRRQANADEDKEVFMQCKNLFIFWNKNNNQRSFVNKLLASSLLLSPVPSFLCYQAAVASNGITDQRLTDNVRQSNSLFLNNVKDKKLRKWQQEGLDSYLLLLGKWNNKWEELNKWKHIFYQIAAYLLAALFSAGLVKYSNNDDIGYALFQSHADEDWKMFFMNLYCELVVVMDILGILVFGAMFYNKYSSVKTIMGVFEQLRTQIFHDFNIVYEQGKLAFVPRQDADERGVPNPLYRDPTQNIDANKEEIRIILQRGRNLLEEWQQPDEDDEEKQEQEEQEQTLPENTYAVYQSSLQDILIAFIQLDLIALRQSKHDVGVVNRLIKYIVNNTLHKEDKRTVVNRKRNMALHKGPGRTDVSLFGDKVKRLKYRNREYDCYILDQVRDHKERDRLGLTNI